MALDAFLRYESAPLSLKATSGFLRRTESARLRFPPGFLDALRKHAVRMNASLEVTATRNFDLLSQSIV
jgi:DNA (cytosine-5)-methyltransferase 1